MALKKSRKRNFDESNEFMPLSKGKLFESDDDCDYDWGFKKTAKTDLKNDEPKPTRTKKADDVRDVISKKFVYKSADPLKLKDDDRQMYMANLTKIYERSYVYVPSFYDVDDVNANTNKLIDTATRDMLAREIASVSDNIDQFWLPLNKHYVDTNRLSSGCSAHKMIVRCLEQCMKEKSVLEGCMDSLASHAADYRAMLISARDKDVDAITGIFRDAVGDILLAHKDRPAVTFEQMASGTNRAVFMRMVADDIGAVRARVETVAKGRKARQTREKNQAHQDELDAVADDDEPQTAIVAERPAPKSILDNKGLVPKRKKADANPRVKHRMKFKKAIVRYHSQVPRSRDDVANYEGEQSGIRIGVIKARKFK